MSKLICLSHPKYDGKESPVLACKTCCGIFISQIKEENDTILNNQEDKRRKVIQRRAEASKMAQSGISPDMI